MSLTFNDFFEDITIASENAKFSVPGAKTIGLYCHSPAVELARAVPRKIAMDLLVTGDFLEASDAYRAGMISRLVGDYDACVAAVEGSFYCRVSSLSGT